MEEATATESSSPSGKARTALLLLKGYIPWSKENVEILYQCLNCKNCKVFCPFEDFNLADLIRQTREEAAKRKTVLPETVFNIIKSLEKYGNPYGEKSEGIEAVPEEAELIYFPGCTVEFREKEIIQATLKVLRAAGIKAHLLKGFCCGWPALHLGNKEIFMKLGEAAKEYLKPYKGKILLTSCPSCFECFSRIYPEAGIDLGVKVMHTSVFFSELLRDKRIKLKTLPKKVAYHDPCALGREMGIFEEPRAILSSLGLKIIEPEKTKEFAKCCGGGGIFSKSFKVTQKRRDELLATKADIFVTACPTCKMMLKKLGLKIQDLSEILASSIVR